MTLSQVKITANKNVKLFIFDDLLQTATTLMGTHLAWLKVKFDRNSVVKEFDKSLVRVMR